MPDHLVVRITPTTWQQQVVARYLSRDAARLHRAVLGALTPRSRVVYETWPDPQTPVLIEPGVVADPAMPPDLTAVVSPVADDEAAPGETPDRTLIRLGRIVVIRTGDHHG